MVYYLWWADFLPPDLLADVQQVAIGNQDKFVPTSVSTGEEGYRKSHVLWHYHFQDVYQRFTDRIRSYLPLVQEELGLSFTPGMVELQMTASNGGDYFRQHNDNGTPDTETRRLTYVHYFLLGNERKFDGGTLRLQTPDGNDVHVQPNHNSIVWFPSHYWHEVMPVTLNGTHFLDGRLTCNGWVRTA